MSTVRTSGISLEGLAMLVGSISQQSRNNTLEDAGARLDDKEMERAQARASRDEKKADAKRQQVRLESSNWAQRKWSHFWPGETRVDIRHRRVQSSALALEKAEKNITEKQRVIDDLRGEAKDVLASYDASNDIYQNMLSEAELSKTGAV